MNLSENITGVQHLGIPVVNLKEAVAWYEGNLGFKKFHEKIVMNPYKIEVAFLQLGDLVLELFQPSGSELAEVSERKDGILDHYAIDVPDLERCVNDAVDKGLKFHASTGSGITHYEHLGRKGVKGANFVGPNQEVVEFCHDDSADYGAKAGLQGWAHLAVKVKSLKDSMAFYEKLGFHKTGGGYLDTPDGRIEIAFVYHKGFTLELIQMVGAGLEELKTRGAGHIDHIALDVCDIEEAFYEAKKIGLQSLDYLVKELPFFQFGVKFFTVVGPDGEKVEFNQKKCLTFSRI